MKKMICLMLVLVLCLAAGAGIAESPVSVEIFGTLDSSRYENATMGLGCTFDGWNYRSQYEILLQYGLVQSSSPEEVAKVLEDNQSVMVMYAETENKEQNVNVMLDLGDAPYIKENGEEAFFQELIKMYEEQLAPEQGWKDFTGEITERQIGDKKVFGVKDAFTVNGMQIYQLQLGWLNGDYVDVITITSYFNDECDSILEHFYMLGE